MKLIPFICLFTFAGVFLICILAYLLDYWESKRRQGGPWPFRVEYSVILCDFVTGKTLESTASQQITAWSVKDAIRLVKEELEMRGERETKDFGASPCECSDFKAIKL